jgi:hypothetical protein
MATAVPYVYYAVTAALAYGAYKNSKVPGAPKQESAPTDSDEEARAHRRRVNASQEQRQGRLSTILSDQPETLG